MAKKIDTGLKTVKEMFSNDSGSILEKDGVFIIPEYQRAYNWKFNEQCEKLWQDIEAFIDAKKNEYYFFGSIIINSVDEKLYIIDGQQRITTFMLLLKAILLQIVETLKKISDDEDTESIKNALKNRRDEIINYLYVIDKDDVSLVVNNNKPLKNLGIKYENNSINEEYLNEVKIILQGESFDEIERTVEKIKFKQGNNKYTNFFRNFMFFYDEKLSLLDSTQLNRFAKALLQECQLILVVSYQTEEAIEIFNSLNSTGMPLNDADIISAKLYTNYGEEKGEFNEKWKRIVESTNNLGAQKISTVDDILNQYMYILRAKNDERDTTMPGVRRYFTNLNPEAIKSPKQFVSDVEKIIEIWEEEEYNRELLNIKQILFRHNNNFRFFYATYFYFNREEKEEIKLQFAEALLKIFAILSINENSYSSSQFKIFLIYLNMDIGAGNSTAKIVEKIKKHINKEFNKENIRNKILEAYSNTAMVYLNDFLFAREVGEKINLDSNKIEVEHIMPASGKNSSAIRADAKMTEEEFNLYANKIGNKILLEQPINGSISNEWFKVKKQNSISDKKGYKDSKFQIAKSLTKYKKMYGKKMTLIVLQ